MSLPYQTIACLDCDYQATSLVRFGKFIWRSGNDEYWFDRDLGLCMNCCGVVAIERFPDPSIFEKALKRRSIFWRRTLHRFGSDAPGVLASEEGFDALACVMGKKREPVCLSCCKTDVEPLFLPDNTTHDTSVRELNVSHPCCGGRLTAQGSGINRLAPVQITRVYDIAGQIIDQRLGWK